MIPDSCKGIDASRTHRLTVQQRQQPCCYGGITDGGDRIQGREGKKEVTGCCYFCQRLRCFGCAEFCERFDRVITHVDIDIVEQPHQRRDSTTILEIPERER